MVDEGNVAQGELSKPLGVRFMKENQEFPPVVPHAQMSTVHHPQPPTRASSRSRSASRGRSRARRDLNPALPNKGPLVHSDPHSSEGHRQVRADPSTSRPPRPSPAHAHREGPQQTSGNRSRRTAPQTLNMNQPQPRSWAAVAKSATKGYTLSYIPPHRVDNRVVAEISDDILEDADPKWKDTLVGYFIGRKLPFRLVEEALKHIWGHHLHELKANDDGFFFMHIPDSEFRRSILDGGCFTVARVPLILQQFTPLVDLQRARHQSIPIWIKLRNVPYSLWSPRGLSAIASGVGKPLYVDSRTEKMSLLSFARVCVEIEGGVTLPDHVDIHLLDEVRTIKVEYEWKPSFCSQCATFGHKCPTPSPPPPAVDVPVSDDAHTVMEDTVNKENMAWTEVGSRRPNSSGKVVGDFEPLDTTRKKATVVGLAARHSDAQPDMNRNKAVMVANSSISEDENILEEDICEEVESDGCDEEGDSAAVEEFVVKSTIPDETPVLSKSARRRAKKRGTNRDPPLDVSSSSNSEVPIARVASRSVKSSKSRK